MGRDLGPLNLDPQLPLLATWLTQPRTMLSMKISTPLICLFPCPRHMITSGPLIMCWLVSLPAHFYH